MIKQKSNDIANTASGAGMNGVIPLGAYSASKFAIVGYTEVLRAELLYSAVRFVFLMSGKSGQLRYNISKSSS